MSKLFQVIVADCPWAFSDVLQMSDVKRGAAANYPTMSLDEIVYLPVNDIADPKGCLLALWVPSSLLPQGLQVMEAWGFQMKQSYIWVKTKKEPLKKASESLDANDVLAFGMGRLFRQTHEICLIGTNNNGIYQQLMNKSQRSVSLRPNRKHSAKPEDLQDSLELMFPKAKKLELFARRKREGWTCLGNEVCSGEDIHMSLLSL